MVGEHMYLFGGYGGYGYARRELDDLHYLDISTMRWSEITNAKGFPPDKRSGHQACNIQSTLVISGGKNSEIEFRDIHVLDLEADPPVWSNYYEALPECRWNFAARSFMAMPKWRMFIFGGKGRQNEGYGGSTEEEYLNDVLTVDTQTFKVQSVEVLGEPPPPRADMEMVFDAKHGQMVVFSGYGVEWMNDIYFLDISSMVGPSYSLKDIFPRVGPVTGGTEIDILGLDFPNTHDVTVSYVVRL
jgi:dynein heavy chain, axonemal